MGFIDSTLQLYQRYYWQPSSTWIHSLQLSFRWTQTRSWSCSFHRFIVLPGTNGRVVCSLLTWNYLWLKPIVFNHKSPHKMISFGVMSSFGIGFHYNPLHGIIYRNTWKTFSVWWERLHVGSLAVEVLNVSRNAIFGELIFSAFVIIV